MRNTPCKAGRGGFNCNAGRGEFNELKAWLRENAEDNQDQLDRLRRNLKKARKQELTPRQQRIVEMRFEQDMSLTEIADELGVNKSTVSRTLRRAKDRLRRYLQYSF